MRSRLRLAKRLEEILVVFVRFGFADWIGRLGLGKLFAGKARLRRRARSLSDLQHIPSEAELALQDKIRRYEHMRLALERLGPTFVKFGQILSNRADILPPEMITELGKLQDRVPPFAFDLVKKSIQSELGAPIGEVYASFDAVPIASASIAQVHEAWLLDGRHVAVKVQRPDIERVILADLEVLSLLARLIQRHVRELRPLDPVGMVEEFRKQILKELDFSLELSHMERFASIFRDRKGIHVPKGYSRYSSRRVITMEFVKGRKLSDMLASGNVGSSRKKLARNLAELMLEQVFWHGYFHADPHPGNILVLPDGVACFLDFGMMGRVQAEEQKVLLSLLVALATRNYKKVCEGLLKLVEKEDQVIPGLEIAIEDFLEMYFDRPLGDIDFGRVFERLIHIIHAFSLKIPPKYLLMAKALIICEGVGSRLSPNFSFFELFAPFAQRSVRRQLEPRRMTELAMTQGEEYLQKVKDLPLNLVDLVSMAKKGQIAVNFKVQGLNPLRETIEAASNSLIFGLLLAAILVSSSMLLQSKLPPLINDVSALGLVGYGIAGLMSLGFLISIIMRLIRKSRKDT